MRGVKMSVKTVSRAAKMAAAGLIITGFAFAPKLLKSQDLQAIPYSQMQPSKSAQSVSSRNDPKDINNYAVDCFRFNGNHSLALTYFQRALECGGGAAVDYNIGTAYLLTGKIWNAISEFRKAIDLSPFFAHAHYNLACALFASGDMDGAMASFKKAISLDPTNTKYADGYKVALLGSAPAPRAFVKIQ